MRFRLLLNLLGLCCLLAFPLPGAYARKTAAPGAAMNQYEEGKQAFKDGHFAEALAAFQSSMELEASPNTRFQIAKCYVALGKTGSAYANFKRAAQEAEDRVNATGEKRYSATKEAALAEQAALEDKVPRLKLGLPAQIPPGLTITIDGAPVPPAAFELAFEVDPGQHQLVASGPRLKRYTVSFEAQPGALTQQEIPIEHVPTATLRLGAANHPAGLSVLLDEQPLRPEELDNPQFVDVGTHKLVCSAPGYQNFVWTGFLKDGQEENVLIALRLLQTGPPKWATFVVAGATLAAVIVGVSFGVLAQNASNDQQMLDPLLRSPSAQDSIRTNAIVANTFFGLSGVLAINTVILAATTRWRTPAATAPKKSPAPKTAWLVDPSMRPSLRPFLGPESFGLSLTGRF